MTISTAGDVLLSDLVMTIRTANVLAQAGLATLSQIEALGAARVRHMIGVGPATFAEIERLMTDNGRAFT